MEKDIEQILKNLKRELKFAKEYVEYLEDKIKEQELNKLIK